MYGFVKLDEVYYAGSHGMDIRGPSRHHSFYEGKYQSKSLDEKVRRNIFLNFFGC